MKGKLYIVATPIGNLEDMTLRGIRILGEAGLIAAEDTRRTRVLLNHYGITTPLTSYYEGNERRKAGSLISHLKQGMDVALVSDAGTPGVSDPGYRLITEAIENSISVLPVPGPSALLSSLIVSGLPTDAFYFAGFLPSKKNDRRRLIEKVKRIPGTIIIFETALRVEHSLTDILDLMGDIQVVIARELTKLHEEILRGRVSEVLNLVGEREIKGEITMLLSNDKSVEAHDDITLIQRDLKKFLKSGITLRDAVQAVTACTGVSKRVVYSEALKIKEQ